LPSRKLKLRGILRPSVTVEILSVADLTVEGSDLSVEVSDEVLAGRAAVVCCQGEEAAVVSGHRVSLVRNDTLSCPYPASPFRL
jgi:hypothetical protein